MLLPDLQWERSPESKCRQKRTSVYLDRVGHPPRTIKEGSVLLPDLVLLVHQAFFHLVRILVLLTSGAHGWHSWRATGLLAQNEALLHLSAESGALVTMRALTRSSCLAQTRSSQLSRQDSRRSLVTWCLVWSQSHDQAILLLPHGQIPINLALFTIRQT